MYDPWVNEVLHRSANPLRVHPHRYRLPDVLAGARQLRWREGNVLVNEEKVRLLTDLTPAAIGAGAAARARPVEAHPKSTRLDAIPFTPTLAGLIQALESLQQDPSLAFCSLAATRFAVTFLTRADNRQLALLRIDP